MDILYKASLELVYSTHAVCHAVTNPMLRNYIVLLSSSSVIENYQYGGQESVSDSISVIEVPTSTDCVRTILTTFYHMNHYKQYWHTHTHVASPPDGCNLH